MLSPDSQTLKTMSLAARNPIPTTAKRQIDRHLAECARTHPTKVGAVRNDTKTPFRLKT
jgi:hypothetical protein